MSFHLKTNATKDSCQQSTRWNSNPRVKPRFSSNRTKAKALPKGERRLIINRWLVPQQPDSAFSVLIPSLLRAQHHVRPITNSSGHGKVRELSAVLLLRITFLTAITLQFTALFRHKLTKIRLLFLFLNYLFTFWTCNRAGFNQQRIYWQKSDIALAFQLLPNEVSKCSQISF